MWLWRDDEDAVYDSAVARRLLLLGMKGTLSKCSALHFEKC